MAFGISAGTAFIDVLPNMAGFVAGIQRGVSGLSSKISSTGLALTKGLTLPIVGAGVAAVKLAADFETTLDHIVGLVGFSREQVNRWGEDILDLSAELPQAPKELAEALYFITSAGIPAAEAMDVLDASARAAAAGLGETQVVADTITSAINAYGSDVLDASEATDILTNAVRLGKAEAASIAPVLGSILPTASELGVSFADVAASIAAMTRTGDSAASAATKTNAIFSALVKTTDQQDDAFKAAGTSAADLRDSLAERGLLPTLLDLRDAVGGNIAKLADMFPNVRALRGVLSLTGNQAEINEVVFRKMADSLGIAKEAFDAVSDSAEFRLKAALSSLQALAIRFGTVLLPIVAKAADLFGQLFEKISAVSPELRNVILIVLGIAAAIGPVLFIFGKLLLILTPVGLVITALALAGYAIYKNWSLIGPKVMPVLERLRDFAIDAWEAIKRVVLQVKAFLETIDFGAIFESIQTAVAGAIEWFQKLWKGLKPVRDAISFVAEIVGRNLRDAFVALGDVWTTSLLPALKNLWEALQALWDPVLKAIAIVLGVIIAVVLILISKALPPLIRLIGTLIRWFSKLILAAAKIIQFLGRLIGIFVRFGIAIVKAVGKAVGSVVRFFQRLPGQIIGFVSSIPGKVINFFAKLGSGALKVLGKILNWFKELPGKAQKFLLSLPSRIGDIFRSMANTVIGWWNALDLGIHFNVSFPGWIPGVGGKSFGINIDDIIPDVPPLATGGIVLGPTLALVGERGPEAVVPLDQWSGGMDGKTVRIVDSNLGLVMEGVIEVREEHGRRMGRNRR